MGVRSIRYVRGTIRRCILGDQDIGARQRRKTHRDEYMESLHLEYPLYAWNRNMGYPTRAHRKAVLEHGPTPFHRRSFRLLDDQMRFDFS